MAISLTKIADLDRDRIPVTIVARVRSVRPAPRELVSQDGILEDDGGQVAFTVWEDSAVPRLRAGEYYIFHRAGLGLRDGRMEVRITQGSEVHFLRQVAAADGLLRKIGEREEILRARLARAASAVKGRRKHKGLYSTLITAALFIWAVLMFMHFSGLLKERPVREFLEDIGLVSRREDALERRDGKVEEVLDARTIRLNSGGEQWVVHYKGLLTPSLEADGSGRFPPEALRARNYNRYLVGDKNVAFEFIPPAPDNREVWGYVFVGNELVNASLLAKGFARLAGSVEKLHYSEYLITAEEGAKMKKLGIWREKAAK